MSDNIAIMRGFRGEPFVVCVCGANRRVVLVTGEANYEMLKNGLSGASPIGVPRADVFCYNQELYQELLNHWQHDTTVWDRLVLWEDTSNDSTQETETA